MAVQSATATLVNPCTCEFCMLQKYLMNSRESTAPYSILNFDQHERRSSYKVAAVATTATVGGAVAGAVAAPVLVTTTVGALGFGAGGIGIGTVAAGMMSSAAIANGGAIAAGSTVAILQSIGAAGLGTLFFPVIAAGAVAGVVIVGVGGGVGYGAYKLYGKIKSNSTTVGDPNQ